MAVHPGDGSSHPMLARFEAFPLLVQIARQMADDGAHV